MSKPTLWHIEISHYSEKARWALDYKGIEHQRRAPTPGAHIAVALWLTRGRCKTFPVLQLDGEAIGDTTAIIAALERALPRPTPLSRGSRRAPSGTGVGGVLRRAAGSPFPPARLPRGDQGPCGHRALHGRSAAWPPGRDWASPRRGDALLLNLHCPSLRGEERSPGGAREGQHPGGLRSARIRPRSGRLPRRRPVHRRRPHRGLAPLPLGASAGGTLASAAPGGIRALPRAAQGASRLPAGCRRCSAATGSRRPRRRPPDYRFTEPRRSPRPRPGRRTGARRPRSPSGRDGRPHPRAPGPGR